MPFKENREKLRLQLAKKSVAILHANDQMFWTGDQYFKYRQNSDLFYFTGIEQEKTILVITSELDNDEQSEILFILHANPELEVWEGHKLSIEEARKISGITNVRYIDEFDDYMHALMIENEHVYINLHEHARFDNETKDRNHRYFEYLKDKYPLHIYKRLAPLITPLRLIKNNYELEAIRKAISITKNAFIRVLKTVNPGMLEYEVEAEIAHEFIKSGANGHAFHPIVASGKNACTLHYETNRDVIKNGELILIDFGAVVNNYNADCSRTFPANGKFSPRQKEVYEACLKVFKYARELMKPGETINRIHAKVCKFWEKEHQALGLYTKDSQDSTDAKLWFKYYMHGTSHFLGLDTHDVGSKDIILKPGMIITCEPGIYITEEQIGIRIENDILITISGNEDLMKNYPLEVEEIEMLMNSN